ncbi:MAG: hypothetical protein FWF46_03530 [Oscillospiraceae bacterium]|nr:hypothetical protein [Oscillospiraceae bacterium]
MSEQLEVTVRTQCFKCGGSGLIVNWLCHNGAATICNDCNGNGYTTLEYIPFTGIKETKGIKRVFYSNEFQHVYTGKHTLHNGKTLDFSQFGCTYEEWRNGIKPIPLPKRNQTGINNPKPCPKRGTTVVDPKEERLD